MKKKYILPALVLIVLACWYVSPTFFLKNAEDVASIQVFNASNGHAFVIEDPEDAAYIVGSIQSQRFQREEISLFQKGSLYHLSFLDSEGKEQHRLIINSDKWIRRDPFTYFTDGDMEIMDLLREREDISKIDE